MFIYIFLATILFLVAYFTRLRDKTVPKVLFRMTLVLVLFDGLRWESGTDWGNYHDYFIFCLSDYYDRFETGYMLTNKLIRHITSSYTVFLIIHAVILYTSLFFFLKKNSVAPLFSLAWYFASFVPYQGMNRQFIALACCMLAFNYLLDGKKYIFLILVFIGGLFHLSSYIFFLGLLFKKQYSVKSYLIILVTTIFIGNVGIVDMITNYGLSLLNSRMLYLFDFYTEKGQTTFSIIALLLAYFRRLLWIIPLLLYMQKEKVPKVVILCFNYYFVGFLFYILFNGTALQVMVSRGNVYFMVFECILIPYILYVYRKNISRATISLLLYLFALINMVKGIQSYDVLGKKQNPFIPYKSIYYNTDIQKNTK